MNFRRLLRGPAIWVLLIVIIGLFALQIGQIGKSYQRIDTSAALQLISDGKVQSVELVNGDQRMSRGGARHDPDCGHIDTQRQ